MIANTAAQSSPARTVEEFQRSAKATPRWQTQIVPTLASLSDEALRGLTAGSHIFAGAEWFRLLERIDLAAVTGGTVELQFAVVSANGTPVAVCPLLRASGEGLLALYSIRRYYFEYLFEQAGHSRQGESRTLAIFARIAARARQLLEWAGCSLDDFFIVCNPLSYRGSVSMTGSADVSPEEIARELISALQQYAGARERPLCFHLFEDHEPMGRALLEAGCRKVFLFYDNDIRLSEFRTFDDYLQAFPTRNRKAIKSELRRTAAAGITFRWVGQSCSWVGQSCPTGFADSGIPGSTDRTVRPTDFTELADKFTRLYEQTYLKHSASIFRQPPEFWTVLQSSLGQNVEAVLAERGSELVGFLVTLNCERRREMWTYRGGRHYDGGPLDSVPYYFPLGFYEPIRRAIELGHERIWLGPAGYEAKLHRGAEQTPLFSYFWFPKRRDWLVGRYLYRAGQIVRRQIADSLDVPLRLADRS